MSLLRNFSPGGGEPDDDQAPVAARADETAPPGGQAPGTARYAFAGPAARATPAHPTVPSEVVTDPDDPGEEDDREDETAAPAAGARDPVLTPPDVEADGAQDAPPPFGASSPETAAAPETAPMPPRPATPATLPSPRAAGGGELSGQPAAAAEPDFAAPLLRDAAELRARWQRVQGDFVDDPRAAVSAAADLVGQTVGALMEALRQRQRQLRTLWEPGTADGSPTAATAPGGPDTEELRLMMQRYRALFNELCRPS
jgi:hypothetical protein